MSEKTKKLLACSGCNTVLEPQPPKKPDQCPSCGCMDHIHWWDPAKKGLNRYVADFECRELTSTKTFVTITGIQAKNYPDAFKRAFKEWRKRPGVSGKRFSSFKVTLSEIKGKKYVQPTVE